MSRRASSFRQFMGSTVADTTQRILSNNSRTVHEMAERLMPAKTQLGNDTMTMQMVRINATAPMNPAKAQRIAASLHKVKK